MFLSYAAGTGFNQVERVDSGSSGDFDEDDLMDLVYALKGAYRQNAMFGMKRQTIRKVRKLKDGEGQYLWAPGLQANEPNLLLGYPVMEFDDMTQTGSAGAESIVFADMRSFYQIVDRIGIRLIRDIFFSKAKRRVLLH